MNCVKCGAPLVQGQTICSNCDTDNSNFIFGANNNYQNGVNTTGNINVYQSIDRGNEAYNDVFNNEVDDKEIIVKKQNGWLRSASLLELFFSIAMAVVSWGGLFIDLSIGRITVISIIEAIISLILIVCAFLLNKFNLAKGKFFNNKVLIIIALIINLVCGFLSPVFFVVFALGLIGFMKSIRKEEY